MANKMNAKKSAMAIDQCHEQKNDYIKGEGGAVGLTECPEALERCMIAETEISRLILEFEDNSNNSKSKISTMHHEQSTSMQKAFEKELKSLVATSEEMSIYEWKTRAIQNKPLSITITKNNFHIFAIVTAKNNSKARKQIKHFKSDCDLF